MLYQKLPLELLLKTIQVMLSLETENPRLEMMTDALRIVDNGVTLLAAKYAYSVIHQQIWALDILRDDQAVEIEGKVRIGPFRVGGYPRPILAPNANPWLLIKNAQKLRQAEARFEKKIPNAEARHTYKTMCGVYSAGGIIDIRTRSSDPNMAIGGYIMGTEGFLVGVNFSNNKREIRQLQLAADGNVYLLDKPIDELLEARTSSLNDFKQDETMTNIRARCITHNAKRKKQHRNCFQLVDRYFEFFMYWNEDGTTEWTRFDERFP